MTVHAFFAIYTEFQKQNQRSSTMKARSSCLRCHLLPRYGNEELASISSSDIDAIYRTIEQADLAPNTLFGCAAAMRSFFHMAEQQGLIAAGSNPVLRARTVRPQRMTESRAIHN